jgi:alpha/beta superfamily hydrolase
VSGASAADEPRVLDSEGFRLTGVVRRPAGPVRGSVAISHPHPGHGGNSDHSVVRAIAERAAAAGFVALRFDVRGVRESAGDVDDILGHLVDHRVASEAAAQEAPGLPRLGAGFSYGARLWLELVQASDAPSVERLVLLAPATRIPKTARDFGDLLLGRPIRDAALDARALERLAHVPVPTRILVGENDVVAPPHELSRHAGKNVTIDVLPGLNHFFSRSVGAGPTALDLLVPALDRAFSVGK